MKFARFSNLVTALIILSVVVFLAGMWFFVCQNYFKDKSPNVVLIVIDTCRADRLSCYGYSKKTTPNIDALAQEGILYEWAYATDFWTLPSHASLFTGLYPTQAGATSETNHLPLSNTTIAETLKKEGYETAAFVCNTWISRERGFDQGFDEYLEMWRSVNKSQVPQQHGWNEWATIQKTTEWLKSRRAGQKPFFMFINLNCVHMPYRPPEPHLSRFVKPESGYSNDEVSRMANIAGMWRYLAGELKLSERDLRIMGELYDGEVAFADYCIGEITRKLKDLNALDNTVMIVTADHGENLGEHGLIDHLLSMYETTLHIPLVIRYPKRFKPGVRNTDLVSLINITPTILELCDIKEDIPLIRPSETSLAFNERLCRTFIVAENDRPMNGIKIMKDKFQTFDTSKIDYRMRALRTDHYKLIWNIGGSMEMYDIRQDPGELDNIADDKPGMRNKLHTLLRSWMDEISSSHEAFSLESRDQESLEILRSLGYVE